jgi:integrase
VGLLLTALRSFFRFAAFETPTHSAQIQRVLAIPSMLNKHRVTASNVCRSLKQKRVTVHRLRHTMAMDLLQAGVDRSVIALWLGHEHVETRRPTPRLPEQSVEDIRLCRAIR